MTKAFVERLVLPCRDVERSLRVYRDVLGFAVVETSGHGVDGSVDLGRDGADGGGIRLVPQSGDPIPTASLALPGPYGMTLYTTQFDAVMDRLGTATGHEPNSISYTFPGSDILVREGTVPGPDGLNIFMVEYDPARHRCCIGQSDATVSEIVAVGFVVDSIAAAVTAHEQALGAKAYMDEVFTGEGVEKMNFLEPGTKLHVAFLRGVNPGNARLELLESNGSLLQGRGQVDGVSAICRVPGALDLTPVSLVPGATLVRVSA